MGRESRRERRERRIHFPHDEPQQASCDARCPGNRLIPQEGGQHATRTNVTRSQLPDEGRRLLISASTSVSEQVLVESLGPLSRLGGAHILAPPGHGARRLGCRTTQTSTAPAYMNDTRTVIPAAANAPRPIAEARGHFPRTVASLSYTVGRFHHSLRQDINKQNSDSGRRRTALAVTSPLTGIYR